MPWVRVTTNAAISDDSRQTLLREISRTAAKVLGKPEAYLMASLQADADMMMGGETAPAAMVEIRAVGSFNREQTAELSETLTTLLTERTEIKGERVFVNFVAFEREMWAMAGRTFG